MSFQCAAACVGAATGSQRKMKGKKSSQKKRNGAGTARTPNNGDYKASIGSLKQKMDKVLRLIPKGTFGRAGGAAGMALGGPAAAALGGSLGRGLAAITGYGDYRVNKNSLSTISTSMDTVPQFVRNEHSVRVTHREYVRDVVVPPTPTAFVNTATKINPGNQELFPWLAAFSKQYQQYRVHGMVVEYKTMSSDYAASGPLGTVAIATNYNVLDQPYSTKIELENSEFAVSTKPSRSLIHAIECDPRCAGLEPKYVRDASQATTGSADDRLYDVGTLQIATAGLPGVSGATLGELWVSYDIEFLKPIISPASIGPGDCPATVSGTVIVSQGNGALSRSGGQVHNIRFFDTTPPAFTATTSYNYMDQFSGADGDTALFSNVVDPQASGIYLRKNGKYRLVFQLKATCTATNAIVSGYANPVNTDTTFTVNGTAVAVQSTLIPAHAPHNAGAPSTGAAVYTVGAACYEFDVSGIAPDALDTYVLLTYPKVTPAATSLAVPSLSNLYVSWYDIDTVPVYAET